MRTSRPAARLAACAGEFSSLQALEPRKLLAYLATPIGDAFEVDANIFSLTPPDGAIVEGFGWRSVGLGDINEDGKGDFAVSAPGQDGDGPTVNGVVFVYSGADRSVLATIQGTTPLFGFSLLNVGDSNGDGFDDLAIGSPGEGVVRLYSALSGNLLRTFSSDQEGSEFGYSMVVQANADGEEDPGLIIGAPGHGSGGAVFAFNLPTGAARFQVDGAVSGSRFGHAVAPGRDYVTDEETLTTDGFDEFLVTAPGASHGRVYAINGATGDQLGVHDSSHANFGAAIIPLFPSNSEYFYVGVPGEDGSPGSVANFSLYFNGTQFSFYEGSFISGAEESFGTFIVSLGNLDGRLGNEFAVGAPSDVPGERAIYVMGTFNQAGPMFQDGPGFEGATGFGALGDVNGDGFADVLRTGADDQGDTFATAYSSYAYFELQRPTIVSRNGEFMAFAGLDNWYPQDYQRPVVSGVKYALHEGVLTTIDKVPGVGNDFEILAANDDGVIVGFIVEPPDFSWQQPVRVDAGVIVDGERQTLDGLIANIEGPTDIDVLQMNFKRVGPTGDILIEEFIPQYPATPRAWVLTVNGSLVFLWNGYVEDQAADGTILGTERPDQTVDGETRLWTRAGGEVAIPKFFNAGRLNDDHEIIGTDQDGHLAVFRNGQVTRIARYNDVIPEATAGSWTVFGIDSRGRGFARLDWSAYNQPPGFYASGYSTFVIEEDNQLARLDTLIALGTPPAGLWADSRQGPVLDGASPITALNSGDLIVQGTFLSQVDSSEGLVADDRGVRSVSAGPTGMRAVAINPDGIPISFQLIDNAEWRGRSLTGLAGTLSEDGDLAVFVDPKDGITYAVTLGRITAGENVGNGTVTLYRELSDGTFGDATTLNDPSFSSQGIANRLTVFVSADNRVHIIGLNEDGQLIMFYQTGNRLEGDPTRWEWFYQNVELAHLEPNGQTTPAWVDELTVYVAPWNGMNIAGLTADGDAEVVWWAPGQEFWLTDNLSELTNLPTLVGGLTSYVTPWGGLNVAGIDTSGDLQVVWWVPGFGTQWEASNMTTQFDGAKLDPITVSSYVTPWGGLNIAGIDIDSGEAVVYWWAPALTDWISEPLEFNKDPDDPLPSGRLLAINNGDQLNLFGPADTGEVIRLYWNPGDGGIWGLQNLTRISV